MFKVEITKKADKELMKISNQNLKIAKKIDFFFSEVLEKVKQPNLLPNAKKLQGFADNRYRWRLGDYRIIGIIKQDILVIEVIKIAHRQEVYEK